MNETYEELKVLGVLRFLYGRSLYRPLMKVAHRYGWHYAPKTVMEDDAILEWCHWCGLRDVTRPTDPQAIVAALNSPARVDACSAEMDEAETCTCERCDPDPLAYVEGWEAFEKMK